MREFVKFVVPFVLFSEAVYVVARVEDFGIIASVAIASIVGAAAMTLCGIIEDLARARFERAN